MKKKATIVSVIIGILAVAAIIVFSAYRSSESYRKAKAAIQWDCSVTCTEESTSAKYVITYSDVKVLSKTGTLTIQNKNDFDIVVHLLCEGEQEVVSDNIPANSFYSFTNVTDKEYTVGIHADVGVAADIRVVVYDGKDTEPYTKQRDQLNSIKQYLRAYLKKHQCPCCGHFTYTVPPEEDCGYICPVCFWENDPFIASDDDPSDSNHGITLNEAKANYLEFGACEEEMLRYVRPPESDENGHS